MSAPGLLDTIRDRQRTQDRYLTLIADSLSDAADLPQETLPQIVHKLAMLTATAEAISAQIRDGVGSARA